MIVIVILCLWGLAQAAEEKISPTANETAIAASTPAPTPPPADEIRTDRLFPQGHVTDTASFIQETHIHYDKDGTKTWDSTIKDAGGEVMMIELAIMKNDRVVTQKIEQRQIGKAFELNVEGDKATFHTFEWADGKRGRETETKTVEANDSFLMGPMTDAAIQKNWESLMAGKTLRADFGIFEASRTVEFKFTKNKDIDENVEIYMKPASFVFKMFVPTIKLRFNKATHKLVYFCGPTPLKVKDGSKWKDFPAEIFYP